MKEKKALFLLLGASFIWGFAFVAQTVASGIIGPFMYNGIRMILGYLVLLPLAVRIQNRHSSELHYFRRTVVSGFLCGVFLFSACVLQQYGIAYTGAGKAGFITSLYTLFVPLLSLLIGKKVPLRIWGCVAVGILGAFLLSYHPGEGGIGKGDILVLICAVLFACQIIVIDITGKALEGPELSAYQFLFGGIVCLIIGLITEPISMKIIKASVIPILYGGVFSCGIAYTFQIVGQKYVQSTKATLALSLESVWAATGGALILGERLSLKELTGCILLFTAVVISQLPEK